MSGGGGSKVIETGIVLWIVDIKKNLNVCALEKKSLIKQSV